jgi:aminobenzoyl-glutamate utilization protein B
MKIFPLILLLFYHVFLIAQPARLTSNKSAAIRYIDQKQKELVTWSNQVWEYAEPSLKETRSAQLLIGILKAEGFTVQENVCSIPTLFIATYGTVKPVIGLFGEYDADPGASNKVVPRKEELVAGGYGHGGNHNLLGIGSLGAALAIRDLIRNNKLKCTIRYYGTTAEGSMGAKTYLARDGYFNDLDLSLYWHPAPATWASTSPWDAQIDLGITLVAKRTNVFRSSKVDSTTLTAVESLMNEMQLIRKEMTASKKINYSIQGWKDELNYIPDTIRLSVRIQCAQQSDAIALLERIKAATESAGKTGVSAVVQVKRAMHQFLPNVTAMKLVQQNMELLGPISYTTEEQDFTKQLQQFLNVSQEGITDRIQPFSDQSKREQLYGYASDIGDASWIAPEIYFIVRTLPGVAMHQWPGTIFSGHSIGHRGMLQASRILAMTVIDYVENKEAQKAIWNDFEENKRSYRYRSLLSPSPSITK